MNSSNNIKSISSIQQQQEILQVSLIQINLFI
jgi:hypothetical protein